MKLLKNRYVQITLAAVLGITVGAVFYPTKNIEERVKKQISESYESEIRNLKETSLTTTNQLKEKLEEERTENREFKDETSRKMTSLTTENRELKQSSKRKKFKLVKPDGTIIEKEYEESQSEEISSVVTEVREEFNRKVSSIENKWKKIHTDRVQELKTQYEEAVEQIKLERGERIVTVEKEKIVEVNKKSLRPEVGVTKDKEAYFHVTYSLWGPVFVGGGAAAEIDTKEFSDARIGVGIGF